MKQNGNDDNEAQCLMQGSIALSLSFFHLIHFLNNFNIRFFSVLFQSKIRYSTCALCFKILFTTSTENFSLCSNFLLIFIKITECQLYLYLPFHQKKWSLTAVCFVIHHKLAYCELHLEYLSYTCLCNQLKASPSCVHLRYVG